MSGTDINFTVPAGNYKPDYVFIIFKEKNQSTSSQSNSTLNSNADIQYLQISLGGELYPNIAQQANWGNNFINQFYEQYKECVIKLTGECSMSLKEYRDLYPTFAFDLTAQAIKVKNLSTQVNVLGKRNSGNVDLQMYVIVLYERFYSAQYLRNEILPKA